MKTRRKRSHWLIGLLASLGALVMATPAAAVMADYNNGFYLQDTVDKFTNCPTDEVMQEAGTALLYCMHVKAYDGELKLGSVEASIDDPITALVGIGLGPGLTPVIVPAGTGSGGAPKPVKISGGILGIPELDPVLDASLGTLSLSATPQLGDLGATAEGIFPVHLSSISLPLSIKLNNTLFGNNCSIGTPEEPFTINLTTGTTNPPEGFEPMIGQTPEVHPVVYWLNYGGNRQLGRGTDALSVDNTFAVPGAAKCDLLPRELHGALEDGVNQVGNAIGQSNLFSKTGLNRIAGKKAGLFDPVINSMAGLPSRAGENYMSIKVDVDIVTADLVYDLHDGSPQPKFTTDPALPGFGEVEVGQTATQTVTFTNTRSTPLVFLADSRVTNASDEFWPDDPTQFAITSNGCESKTLAEGETCEVEVSFSPTSTGPKGAAGRLRISDGGGWSSFFISGGHPIVQLRGTGVSP